ncbi:AcrR family transcriptional regulator [Amycolatopsis bartoniae]|uniref:TetR family transcriptional regulator n=1 Tax=Amycolatopsis bartoniae TaxID=941986 RepID=A0A8H9MF88_9PSEU|nr:TetR/AcrR family transcriptional regulator [Amycolatopsis bartoniae]MBB2938761.1 AcrR family transcriptional regulator [Amycolatopsis bartoniae]GHF79976.1 TetR family transcriptional regulator [Amycolatopsis bartoniae]
MTSRGEMPRRADAARNREHVLGTARAQLAAGDDSLQLNTIARLAGVGVGTVYRHFPTRQSLLEALAAEPLEDLVERAHAAASHGDFLTALHDLLRYALTRILREPSLGPVLESSTNDDPAVENLRNDFDKSLATLLRGAKRENLVRKDVRPADVRLLLCGVAHALHTAPHTPKQTRTYLQILQSGLTPA